MDIIIRKINKIKKHKDCKFVLLINDIAYLRNEKDIYTNADDMKKIEVQIFNYADCLIVHNEKMKAEYNEIINKEDPDAISEKLEKAIEEALDKLIDEDKKKNKN